MKLKRLQLISLAVTMLTALSIGHNPAYSDTLKGSVDHTDIEPEKVKLKKPVLEMPTPVLPASTKKEQLIPGKGRLDKENALKGKAQDDALQGNVEDEGDIEFKRRFGHMDPTKNRLNGSANKRVLKLSAQKGGGALASQDPDYGDKELAIAWDKWRNRFLWSVQSGVTQYLNDPNNPQIKWDPQRQTMVSRFPMGTIAWFSCNVTKDRQVQNLKILHSSGYPVYDRAVLNAVQNLQGSAILKFPRRSKREIVNQNAGIKTATTGQRQFFKFGDVERYRYRP